jgi:hypothetical protein
VAPPPPTLECENEPRDEASRMHRRSHLNAERSHARKEHMPSLDKTATRMPLPEGTNSTTMKNHILRMAVKLNILVSIRKIFSCLLFWRSTDDDIQQPIEMAQRIQSAQTTSRARPCLRRV